MSRAQLTSTVEQSSGGAVAPFLAGKNKVINGDFNIWQRGTSFSSPADGSYSADRWAYFQNGSGRTSTISQQAFTPGTAPVAGYESSYFLRYNVTVAGTGSTIEAIGQRIEDVKTLAGQTVTVSFWAKADTTRTATLTVDQNFGTGGSSVNYNAIPATTINLTTSWQRFTATGTMAAMTGKTIGTGSFIQVELQMPTNTTKTIDMWGWQFEAGSVATPFTTASGTVQGELALCQRYYYRTQSGGNYQTFGFSQQSTTTLQYAQLNVPVSMRTVPTSLDWGGSISVATPGYAGYAISAISVSAGASTGTPNVIVLSLITANTGAANQTVWNYLANNSTGAYIGVSAEL